MMLPIIDILLDGRNFAIRNTWALIPRVGDTVLLKNGEVFAEVTRVVWSDDSAATGAGLPGRQWLQLLCKTIDPNESSSSVGKGKS
jgi:hypothetical protein